MAAVIEHIADDKFVFQQDSELAHRARTQSNCQSVKFSTLFLLSCGPQHPAAETYCLQDLESDTAHEYESQLTSQQG